jgi:hypothetical protein
MDIKMKAGDIILFSGNGFISRIIKIAQMSKYSHVGVMISKDELLESTTLSGQKDIISGKKIKGVQVVDLQARIRAYDGEVYRRPLICENECRLEYITTHLRHFAVLFNGTPYEESELELLGSVFDLIPDQDEDLSSLFCSEMVAEAYQICNLLPDSIPSNEFTPKDFASEAINELLRNVSLGKIE